MFNYLPHQTTFILDFKLPPCCACCILSFGWSWHLNFMCQRFGTLSLFDLHRSCEEEEKLGWDC